MALSDNIRVLRDRTLANLISAHDYFEQSKAAWEIVLNNIDSGFKFSSKSATTGSAINETVLAANAATYVSENLVRSTFQQFISTFEYYFFDLLRLWLTAYPRSLKKKMIDFEAILDAPDKDAITQLVVARELNEILYRRPADWFAYLEDKVILGCPTPDAIDRFAEAKATRDVLVHSEGVASKTYLQKAGKLARFSLGEPMELSETYHRETWEMLCQIVADVSNAALAKAV